ncbi:MAG: glycosyltransferase, partial [Candidatus Muiribacteriota bacterium]
MKVMIISHTSVVEEFRKRFYFLKKLYPELELKVIVPDVWEEFGKWIKVKKTDIDKDYDLTILKPICFFKTKPLMNTTYFFPGLYREIKKFKPDIIDIIEEPYSFITIYTILCKKIVRSKAKVSFFSAQNLLKKYPFPFSYFQKLVFKYSDFAFPVSQEVAEVLKKHGYKKNYCVLPLGTDIDKFKAERNYQSAPEKIKVGFAGRFEKVKGIHILLKAIKMKEFRNVEFLLAGKGSLEEEITKETKNYSNIKIINNLSHEKMPDFYKNIDILIVPSLTAKNWKEQFGRVVVEGMAAGCIVITSDSGEPKNLLNDNRFVYTENSHHDLTEK